jgi:hypothetical protein
MLRSGGAREDRRRAKRPIYEPTFHEPFDTPYGQSGQVFHEQLHCNERSAVQVCTNMTQLLREFMNPFVDGIPAEIIMSLRGRNAKRSN